MSYLSLMPVLLYILASINQSINQKSLFEHALPNRNTVFNQINMLGTEAINEPLSLPYSHETCSGLLNMLTLSAENIIQIG